MQKAFQTGLGLSEGIDFAALEFSKTPQWDSIAHMRLIAAIEEEFKIRLTIQDILGMSSYSVAQEIVQRYTPS
ncbi:MAG: acyl carrier protein [Parachlamydia sp.]|nr:acyl carrier protein [Parachlamydia sp.]